jgi:uncharacterized protein (DUF58 family)
MRGRRYLFQSIDELDRTRPQGETNLKKAAEQFDGLIRSTSLVVLISDLLEETEDVASSIYRLSGHDLIVIQVLAPDEVELGYGGDVKFIDMESRRPLTTHVSQGLREQYRGRLEEHMARISSVCNGLGVDLFSFRTDMPIFDAFSELNSRATVWR